MKTKVLSALMVGLMTKGCLAKQELVASEMEHLTEVSEPVLLTRNAQGLSAKRAVRDPFELPAIEIQTQNNSVENHLSTCQPTINCPLNNWLLKGTIIGAKAASAFLQTPQGEIKRATTEQSLDSGTMVVEQITVDSVVMREVFSEPENRSVRHSLKLR